MASPATCTVVTKPGRGSCKTYIKCSNISASAGAANMDGSSQTPEASTNLLPDIQWQCGNVGQELKCPEGAMAGVCGGGKDAACNDPSKGSTGYHCLGCAIFGGHIQEADNDWVGSYYNMASCPSGTVACGECASGKDANCYGFFARMRCCSVGKTVTPSHRRGYWKYVLDGIVVPGETKTLSFTVNTQYSSGATTQKSWGQTLAETFSYSFEADCEFCKEKESFSVTNSVSRAIAHTYSSTLQNGTTYTESETYYGNSTGCKLWQWVFEAQWPGGVGSPPAGISTTFTSDKFCTRDFAGSVPCCFPQECNMGDNCQTCSDWGYGGHNLCHKPDLLLV